MDNDAGPTQSLHHNVTTLILTTPVASVVAANIPDPIVAALAARHSLLRRALRVTLPEIVVAEVIEFDPLMRD